MDYLCADFVPALAAKLEEFKRWAPDKADAGEPKIVSSSHLLIAFQASLFLLDSELAVYEIERGYEAIGSGCEVATGYLRAVSDWREPSSDSLEAERMVRGALYAAAEFQRGVDGPFHVEKL
jgi:ATP-dependent protease HslVU (ClpYQ) peptidase subunit